MCGWTWHGISERPKLLLLVHAGKGKSFHDVIERPDEHPKFEEGQVPSQVPSLLLEMYSHVGVLVHKDNRVVTFKLKLDETLAQYKKRTQENSGQGGRRGGGKGGGGSGRVDVSKRRKSAAKPAGQLVSTGEEDDDEQPTDKDKAFRTLVLGNFEDVCRLPFFMPTVVCA